MGENKVLIPAPVVPAPEFFADPEYTIKTDDGAALLSYDPNTRAAMIFSVAARRWSVFVPCAFSDFAGIIGLCGFRIPIGDEARRWLAACNRERDERRH
jgi:hypothetical protein